MVATENVPHTAGRIAAQTAKQVVIQRLREAERELVFQEFAEKEGEVFTVHHPENGAEADYRRVGPSRGCAATVGNRPPYDRYRIGQRIKILLQSIRQSNKGPEIIVSRADQLLVKRLFEMEVPEIYNGAVEILAIAREAGSRSKVAVWAKQDGVDAVGSCVGLRGIRIQNIVNELHGEKIDVVQWSKDPTSFIASALSPSTILRVEVDQEAKSAVAIVPERQLSLAIGKDGQNARLAARLTGFRVDIRSDVEADDTTKPAPSAVEAADGDPAAMAVERLALSTRTLNILTQAGIDKVGKILGMEDAELLEVKGFGKKSLSELRGRLDELGLIAPPVAAEAEAAVQAVEEVAAEPVVAEAAEAVPEIAVVEEAAAAQPEVEEAAAKEELPVQEEAVAVEPAPVVAEEAPSEPFIPEEEKKPQEALVAAVDTSTAIRDLTEDVWALRSRAPVEAGAIRFAEDIEELKRGTGSRRGRKGGRSRRGSWQAGRGRKTGAGGRR